MMNRFFHSTIGDETTGGGLNMLDYSPTVWLDAQDSGSIIITSGKVSQWSDLSGNLNHAVQATAAMRPLYGTNAVSNGYNSIEVTDIGGNGIGLELSDSISLAEIIMVTSYKTGVENTFSDFHSIISRTGSPNTFERILGNAGNNNLYGTTVFTDNVYINNGTSTNIILPLPFSVCNFRFTQNTNFFSLLKSDQYHSFDGFTGEIVLFSNQLVAQDRTDIINHLITKWGI